MLDQDAADECNVLRSRGRRQPQVGDTWRPEAILEIERVLRRQEPRPEYAKPQRPQATGDTRERLAMQCVVEHRQQLGLEVHVGGAPGESRQVRLVQAVAEGVEGAGLTA